MWNETEHDMTKLEYEEQLPGTSVHLALSIELPKQEGGESVSVNASQNVSIITGNYYMNA